MSWKIELKEYIARCLKLGFSESEIRSALRSVGWKDNDIEGGFSAISSVIPAKAGIQTGFPIKLGMTDKNKKSKDRVKILSADKTPNLLLPS